MTATTTISVETPAQNLILTDLQHAHHRLTVLLEKIAAEATRSREYANLDTDWLRPKTAELAPLAATYQAFRDAAKWAGCDRDTIQSVCRDEWVSIETVPDA